MKYLFVGNLQRETEPVEEDVCEKQTKTLIVKKNNIKTIFVFNFVYLITHSEHI